MSTHKNVKIDQAATELFQILQSFNQMITMFDENGTKTSDPQDTRYYYLKSLSMVITIHQNEKTKYELRVNVGRDIDPKDIKDLLWRIRGVANKYIIGYAVKTFGKKIQPKDFSAMANKKVVNHN